MVVDLKQVREFFADTEEEAIALVDKYRSEADVTAHQITRKVKKVKGTKEEPGYDFEYYMVKITTQTRALKELLEDLIS